MQQLSNIARMQEITPERLIKVKRNLRDTGKALGVCHATVRNWLKAGRFPEPWPDYLRLKIEAGELPGFEELIQQK